MTRPVRHPTTTTALQAVIPRYATYQEPGPTSIRSGLKLAKCSRCEPAAATGELKALVERFGAGEVSVQPVYVRALADANTSAQVAAIANAGGTEAVTTDFESLGSALGGLDYASLRSNLKMRRFLAFNRNVVVRAGQVLADSDGRWPGGQRRAGARPGLHPPGHRPGRPHGRHRGAHGADNCPGLASCRRRHGSPRLASCCRAASWACPRWTTATSRHGSATGLPDASSPALVSGVRRRLM